MFALLRENSSTLTTMFGPFADFGRCDRALKGSTQRTPVDRSNEAASSRSITWHSHRTGKRHVCSPGRFNLLRKVAAHGRFLFMWGMAVISVLNAKKRSTLAPGFTNNQKLAASGLLHYGVPYNR